MSPGSTLLLLMAGQGTSPPPPSTPRPPAWLLLLLSPPSTPGPASAPLRWAWRVRRAGVTPAAVPLPYDLVEAAILALRAGVPLQGDEWGGWHNAASSEPGYPVGTVADVGATESYMSGGPTVLDGILQVSVVAADRATAKRRADAARDALFDARLQFQRGRLRNLRPAGPARLVPQSSPSLGGSPAFQAVVQLPYTVDSTD